MGKLGASSIVSVSVENSKVAMATCGCNSAQHTVTLTNVPFPPGVHPTGFMVVPVDYDDFEMPVGQYVGGLEDKWSTTTTTTTTTSVTITTTTTVTYTIKPVVSGALRPLMGVAMVLPAAAAAGMALWA